MQYFCFQLKKKCIPSPDFIVYSPCFSSLKPSRCIYRCQIWNFNSPPLLSDTEFLRWPMLLFWTFRFLPINRSKLAWWNPYVNECRGFTGGCVCSSGQFYFILYISYGERELQDSRHTRLLIIQSAMSKI